VHAGGERHAIAAAIGRLALMFPGNPIRHHSHTNPFHRKGNRSRVVL
jgi:hypothetical protein